MTSLEGTIERSKDGVPSWNGEASSFQQYEEVCLQWEQGIPWHKRYLCGPRLIGELSGTARKFIVGKRPDWVSYQGGVTHLLGHLRQSLGRPKISDMTDHLNKYFKNTRRRRQESMNDYITRKTEAYVRARQALGRVEDQFGGQRTQRPQHSWSSQDWGSRAGDWSSWRETPTEEDEGEEFASPRNQPEATRGAEPGEDEEDPWARSWWWSSNYTYEGTYDQGTENEEWLTQTRELLPDFLQGWYLLQDASLDANEKNLIQTAIRGNYGLMRVAQELRSQWPEEELKKRDQGARQSGMWAAEDALLGEEEDPMAYTYEDLVHEGMNEEGLTVMGEAVSEAEMAWTAIQNGKRTLREARAKQHQVKMSRQYYRTTTWKPRAWEKGGKGAHHTAGSGDKMTCLRCGGSHRTSQCPDKQGPRSGDQANQLEEAPFICYNEAGYGEDKGYYQEGSLKSTQEAINCGLGVIDGGATRTLGSVHAIEKVMDLNAKKKGRTGVSEVDTSETPTFGFGNSSKGTCVSTAHLEVSANQKPGVLKVHALDEGSGPVLISISTLRSLGAVIDFANDVAVFRNLDDRKLVKLERSAAGHQLLPLTEDLLAQAQECKQSIPSLLAFC